MENNEIPFFGSSEWKKDYDKSVEEMIKNPPQPVKFTYTIDELKKAYDNFVPTIPVIDTRPGPIYSNDYADYESVSPGDVNKYVNSIYEFYALENKNDLSKVEELYITMVTNSYNIQVPNEMKIAVSEIKKHCEYLRDLKSISDYKKEKENKIIEEEKNRIEKERESKKPKLSATDSMDLFFNTVNNSNKKENIVNAINENSKQEITKPNTNNKEIEELKEQISKYSNQINSLLSNIKPYMQIPKVNSEISKAISRNNETDLIPLSNLNDYKTVIQKKQEIIAYLERANKFIKDSISKKQEQKVDDLNTQKQNQNFRRKFKPIEQTTKKENQDLINVQTLKNSDKKHNYTEEEIEELMKEFDNPKQLTRPERRYNSDGTFTMEYIVYLATTPLGFNQNIYNQLMEENEMKRNQNNDETPSSGMLM